MKRLCYLITFFLTGFSIASNDGNLQKPFVLVDSKTNRVTELEYNAEPLICKVVEDDAAREQEDFGDNNESPVSAFICLAKP